MRNRVIVLVGGLLLLLAASASAQVASAQPASVDLGLRFTDIAGDAARFQRFRDISDGAFLERVRLDRQGPNWIFTAGADHAGRRDQRYFAEYRGGSKVRLSFQWDQIPLFVSGDTRTLYTIEAPGVFRLTNDIRAGIEGGSLRLADVVGRASPFEIQSRRDTARFDFIYSATRELDVKVNFKTARRDGTMPYGTAFGFSNAVELPIPIDTRTTDLNAAVEWANARGMIRVGYDGSWFDNDVQTLVWDNPLKITDSTFAGAYSAGTAGALGRMALWPNSSTNGITTAAAIKFARNTRATATATFGRWNQNEALLPFTINTAIPTEPLGRRTTEARANTLAMNYTLTSRPSPYVWLNARYRYYDFDNRMPPFDARTGLVVFDQVVRAAGGSITPVFSSTRHNLDLDASFTPVPFTAFKVGYGREDVDRTHRIFEKTADNVFRASIDSNGATWITVRGIFERASRRGSHLDEEELEEMGEQPEIRHFDIADRDRNRFTALLQLTPIEAFGASASVAVGKDDYLNSGFGLRDNQNRAYTVTVDLTPRETVAAGLSYSYEKYSALQNSRTASPPPNPQFTDPTRDWSIDSADRVHTANANLDLIKLIPKTDLKFGYNVSRSRAVYVYGVVPGSTIVAPQQLPPVKNELQTGTADIRYFLTPTLAVGAVYWFDRYNVDDFALGPNTINRLDLPGSLFVGYLYRPYTAHSVWLRLTYLW